MGRSRKDTNIPKSHTLPSSPTHSFSSSSSSDFEFTISLSPRKSSAANLCPADELFYKGQLLPLHLSPRISMVRTLLLASSSTSSSSDTTTTASRDSTGSSNDSHSSFSSELLLLPECDSSRPSSATEDDEYKRLTTNTYIYPSQTNIKKSKYFSLSRFSSVFRKDNNNNNTTTAKVSTSAPTSSSSSVKRMSTTAKEVIRKYMKKVKPLYEKLSQNQKQQQQLNHHQKTMAVATPRMAASSATITLCMKADGSIKHSENLNHGNKENNNATISHSFSGNLRYPRRRSIVSSCPSSMRSSPSHSGVLSKNGFAAMNKNGGGGGGGCGGGGAGHSYSDASSMEELQSAIQGAIAHCKNSMMPNKTMVSNEI